MDCATLARKFRDYRDYYFIWDRHLAFVFALMFGRSLIETAFLNVLMWYFTFFGHPLVKSAIYSNSTDALSSYLVLLMMILADSSVGRFRTLFFSNTAYVSGLLLIWLFNPFDLEWLVAVGLALLAIGKSGSYLLRGITFDLMCDIETTHDRTNERPLARAEMLLRVANVCGAICATLWVTPDALGGSFPSWETSLFICTITMTLFSVIFFIGFYLYHEDLLTKRPDWIVIKLWLQKLLTCNSWWGNQPQEDRQDEHRVMWKTLVRMSPIWVTCLVVSAVSATGATFFLEQFNNLNAVNKIPIQIYDLVKKVSSFGIPYVYRWISCSRKNDNVKIGVGMICALICCVLAWRLEVERLEVVQHKVDRDANTSLSFLWLVPQFFVLGCMEGLTKEGVLELYESQINELEHLKSYGEDYLEFVMGSGKLLSILLILIVEIRKGWFSTTINDSRLDKYYVLLAYICLANFIIYCCITLWFYKHTEEIQGQANGNSQQNRQLLAINNSQQDY